MKKILMEVGETFCAKFCKYRPEEACKGPCRPEQKCPLEDLGKVIQEGTMNAEKTLKRVKEQIEWCDEIQNSNDEEPEYKIAAKRIAYDFIRKAVKEGEND